MDRSVTFIQRIHSGYVPAPAAEYGLQLYSVVMRIYYHLKYLKHLKIYGFNFVSNFDIVKLHL